MFCVAKTMCFGKTTACTIFYKTNTETHKDPIEKKDQSTVCRQEIVVVLIAKSMNSGSKATNATKTVKEPVRNC